MANMIDVAVVDDRWDAHLDAASVHCRRAAVAAVKGAGLARPAGYEISIVLADDRMVRGLNRKFRGVDKPTNVLAFPAEAKGTPENRPLPMGDVVLAFQTMQAEAKDQAKSLVDHLAHLVVHGVLHLAGHDHENGADADSMEALEAAILERLGIADPYLVDDPA